MNKKCESEELFRTDNRGSFGEEVELFGEDFSTAAAAEAVSDRRLLLGSLDRADYLQSPTAAAAPTHVAQMSIGPLEDAGNAIFRSDKSEKISVLGICVRDEKE
ncbi:unnamed protein product [Phyllotreta striolata]|uniref:Uncharacterized protein n=1 Tax=Phyllotreta striolata TaxID=444603 RepID=A0A9N9XRK3_PHYSR|nr:unnamed protein product [Phyllotreta striolata]